MEPGLGLRRDEQCRDGRRRALYGAGRTRSSGRGNDRDAAGGEFCGHRVGFLIVAVGRAVFDPDLTAVDVAGFLKTVAKGGYVWRRRGGRKGVQEANHRYVVAMGAGAPRPRDHGRGDRNDRDDEADNSDGIAFRHPFRHARCRASRGTSRRLTARPTRRLAGVFKTNVARRHASQRIPSGFALYPASSE
jgi:hypothetical protein